MRGFLLALLAIAMIGLAGRTAAIAAPANGVVINQAADAARLTENVHCRPYWHWHWWDYGYGCRRYGYWSPRYGYWHHRGYGHRHPYWRGHHHGFGGGHHVHHGHYGGRPMGHGHGSRRH